MLLGALWQLVIGLAIGIPVALLAGRWTTGLLYNVRAYDPLALIGATLALSLSALFAGLIPARRASSIEPMQALRTE